MYTGSSILDLEVGEADLSRRKLEYRMVGLSFCEYLAIRMVIITSLFFRGYTET